MKYKVIIPARKGSKRLPGKNLRVLNDKPLIQYSIEYALNYFDRDDVWVNSDCDEILGFASNMNVNIYNRPSSLGADKVTTVNVLKEQLAFLIEQEINIDAIILLQPTNPLRKKDLLKNCIEFFESSKRNSLATFSKHEKKIGKINDEKFYPQNYVPGQRSQDLEKKYYENGSIYISKIESINKGDIITNDVYPFIDNSIESSVDIDYYEDFLLAEAILNLNKNK